MLVSIVEDQSGSYPNFVTASTALNFTVKAFRYRVPLSSTEWVEAKRANDTGGLFSVVPFVDARRRSLNFTLSPTMNGFVRFSLTAQGLTQNFSVLVKDVNQAPFFALNINVSTPINISRNSLQIIPAFFVNISKGGVGEDGQALFFTWVQIDPTQQVIEDLQFQFDSAMKTATLSIRTSASGWGLSKINVTLHDSQGGTYTQQVKIGVQLGNLQSFFRVAVDLPCNILRDKSICRQPINVLGNQGCFGGYDWKETLEMPSTAYPWLTQSFQFPIPVLFCQDEMKSGEYNLRNFIYTASGSLEGGAMQGFNFSLTLFSGPQLFSTAPRISANGTLRFVLSNPVTVGSATYNLTVSSAEGSVSLSLITLTVWANTFQVQPQIASIQRSGAVFVKGVAHSIIVGEACVLIPKSSGLRFYSAERRQGLPVCDQQSRCRCEATKPYRFDLVPGRPDLFSSISMDVNGTLSFNIAEDWYGSVQINVTLSFLSFPETLPVVLYIFHTDEAPSFQLRNVSLVHRPDCVGLSTKGDSNQSTPSCAYRIPDVFSNLQAGQSNEICANCLTPQSCAQLVCQSQSLSFVIDHISDPSLFSVLPLPSIDGSLSFALWPRSRGEVTLTIRVVDDGLTEEETSPDTLFGRTISGAQVDVGTNTSEPHLLHLSISAENEPPSFTLAREVRCLTIDPNEVCTCPPEAGGLVESPVCRFADEPSVTVLENSGAHIIDGFVTGITASQTVANGMTTFDLDEDGEVVRLGSARREPFSGLPDLSLAVSFAVSPGDQRNVYAAEFESGTLAILGRAGSDFNLTLLGRRAEGESRFRFKESHNLSTQNPCAALPLPGGTLESERIAVMQGCDLLSASLEFLPSRIPGDAGHASSRDYEAEPSWNVTVAYWTFSSYSAEGRVSYDVHDLQSSPLWGCKDDKYDTVFEPAGFADSAGRLPPAQMLYIPRPAVQGAKLFPTPCKIELGAAPPIPLYQHTKPEKQPNVLTYLTNNGVTEALQFDLRSNGGLWVTTDLDTIRDLLPNNTFAVALWFTIQSSTDDFSYPLPGGGLISAIDGPNAGWSLQWDVSASSPWSITFIMKLNTGDSTAQTFTAVQATVGTNEAPFKYQTWHHIVASKNDTLVSLYLDGDLITEQRICAESCDVVFPRCGAKASTTLDSGFACKSEEAVLFRVAEPIPFVIGALFDRSQFMYRPHMGLISEVQLLSAAASEADALRMYRFGYDAHVRGGPIVNTTYWVRATGGDLTPSPSATHCDVTACPPVTVMGKFSLLRAYACRWTYRDLFTDWTGNVSNAPSTCAGLGGLCDPAYGNQLVCRGADPAWSYGFKAATLTVVERDPGDAVSGWRPLWQKACLQADCGYLPARDYYGEKKTDPAALWWVNRAVPPKVVDTYLLPACCGRIGTPLCCDDHPDYQFFGLSRGDLTLFAFTTASRIVSYARDPAALASVRNVTSVPIPMALGASGAAHFDVNDTSYLAVANYWDGHSTQTLSAIAAMPAAAAPGDAEAGGVGGLAGSPTEVQAIPTFGATAWKTFELGGFFYLAVVNFGDVPVIYRWSLGDGAVHTVHIASVGSGYVPGYVSIPDGVAGKGFLARFAPRPLQFSATSSAYFAAGGEVTCHPEAPHSCLPILARGRGYARAPAEAAAPAGGGFGYLRLTQPRKADLRCPEADCDPLAPHAGCVARGGAWCYQPAVAGGAVELYYGEGCAADDSGCATTPQTGSVTKVEVLAGGLTHGCRAGGTITGMVDSEGGEPFKARYDVDAGGRITRVYFATAAGHGSGMGSDPMIQVDDETCRCGTTITGVSILKKGAGYSSGYVEARANGTVGGGGFRAVATVKGYVAKIVVSNGGAGFLSPPPATLTFDPPQPGGQGAAAYPVLTVKNIVVLSPGANYSAPPAVRVVGRGCLLSGGREATAHAGSRGGDGHSRGGSHHIPLS